jgi:GntR family transcriptional regulator
MTGEREEGKIEVLTTKLREQIKREDFGKKGRLPSISELAKTYNVARSTVYQALLLLQAEGLVAAKHSSYYVNPVIHFTTIPTPTFEQTLTVQGLQPFVRNLIEPEIITMPDDIATIFRQPKGLHVVHRYRVQGREDIPYRLSEYWYPQNLAGKYLQKMKDDPGFDTLEAIKKELGITIQMVHDEVLSRIPSKDEAKLLSIPRTSPVQEIRRTNTTTDGTVLMHHRIVFTGPFSILEYNYELKSA